MYAFLRLFIPAKHVAPLRCFLFQVKSCMLHIPCHYLHMSESVSLTP